MPRLCETCGGKQAHFGTPAERTKRWCCGCGKAHGAVYLGGTMCETCEAKHATFGTPAERKKRWCGGCGKAHGAVNLNKRQRPGLAQVDVELQSALVVADVASAPVAAAAAAPATRSRAQCHSDDDNQPERNPTQQDGDSACADNGPQNDGEDVYPVERVLDVRRRRGLVEYNVKWVGYDDPTWEVEDNVGSWWREQFADQAHQLRAPTLKRTAQQQGTATDVPSPRRAQEDCAICLEPLLAQAVSETQCNHQFHRRCLLSWLATASTCPLCKARVSGRRLKRLAAE